jgi:hypothetical protein
MNGVIMGYFIRNLTKNNFHAKIRNDQGLVRSSAAGK